MGESILDRVWRRLADRYETSDGCSCGGSVETVSSDATEREPEHGASETERRDTI